LRRAQRRYPFPFPGSCRDPGKPITGHLRRHGKLVARGGRVDAAVRGERRKRLTDAGRSQAARVPQLGQRDRPIGLRQHVIKFFQW